MKFEKTLNPGFTLIELLVVITVLAIIAVTAGPRMLGLVNDTRTISVKGQASALIAQDQLNVIACKLGNPQCIDISATGTEACLQAIANFMPNLNLDVYSVRNIPSNIPEHQWSDSLDENESVFWVTRFLLNPPSASWLAQGWNVKQPCILGVH